jgi:hypothetical protein
MRRLLRLAGAALVVALAAWAIVELCYVPYESNVIERRVEARSARAQQYRERVYQMSALHNNIDLLAPFAERYPTVNILMLDAANRRLAGDLTGAMASYRRAVALGNRAETFLELGLTALDAGDSATASESLLAAGAFYIGYMLDIPYPSMRDKLIADARNPEVVRGMLLRWNRPCRR